LSGNNLKVGSFKLTTSTKFTNSQPDLNWSFDGNVRTIVTGQNYSDDTDSLSHDWVINGKLPIVNIKASSTTSQTSVNYLLDGVGSDSSSANQCWTTDKLPADLIFDLGRSSEISQTKFCFNNWNSGEVYHYSVSFSNDGKNWNNIIYDATSSAQEYTTNNFNSTTARYVKLNILNNNQNNSATLWEAQITGTTDSSQIKKGAPFDAGNTGPDEFKLLQNYPNPFNPSTNISFSLKESGKVNLDIYNMLGQKVATLIDQNMSKGDHAVTFNGSNLASGVYIYRLAVDNKFAAVKKMMLLK